ncbi:hypothetical protein FRC03_009394 [Tulasnella sp. 419]|nr:hypothetical protein FRC02_008886 [Tulasnella sp. 418]KAG8958159.1 hypothetical protein FRC03_009394 [Tulasnella sp. 419]
MTMEEWLAEVDSLEQLDDIIRFVVTGKKDDDSQTNVLDIDPIQNRISDEQLNEITIMRDYDSLLAYFQDYLPFTMDLKVFVIPRPDDILTVKTNIHVCMGSSEIPLHRIPNTGFATLGSESHLVRLAFPALANRDVPVVARIESTQLADFCNLALLPTVKLVLDGTDHRWPASYHAEGVRARRANGSVVHTQRSIPAHRIEEFYAQLRTQASLHEELAWTKGFFVILEAKGLKERTIHPLESLRDHVEHMEDVLPPILGPLQLDEEFPLAQAMKDIAIECKLPGFTLHWRRDSHARLIAATLNLPLERAEALTRSSHYQVDVDGLISGIAGFRLDCSHIKRTAQHPHVNPFNIVKLNVYMTNKEPTFLKDKGRFAKFLDAKRYLEKLGNDEEGHGVWKYANGMETVYSAEELVQKAGCARLEIRVPMQYMLDVLKEVDRDLLSRSLVAFDTDKWWRYKRIRLHGFIEVLKAQIRCGGTVQGTEACLVLAAACIWAVNALNNRPDDRPIQQELTDACLPLMRLEIPGRERGDGRDDINDFQPQANTITWFIHTLKFNGRTYYLPRSRADHLTTQVGVFFQASVQTIRVERLVQSGTKAPCASNLKRTVEVLVEPSGENDFNVDHIARIAKRNVEPREVQDTLQTIWDSFIPECFEVIPAIEKTSMTYLKGAKDTVRRNITSTPLDELGELFHSYQIRYVKLDNWNKIFDAFFREYGAKIQTDRKPQNWMRLVFFQSWIALTDKLGPSGTDHVRKLLKRKFDTLPWVPFGQKGRLWESREMKVSGDKVEGTGKGPWLAKNPRINV